MLHNRVFGQLIVYGGAQAGQNLFQFARQHLVFGAALLVYEGFNFSRRIPKQLAHGAVIFAGGHIAKDAAFFEFDVLAACGVVAVHKEAGAQLRALVEQQGVAVPQQLSAVPARRLFQFNGVEGIIAGCPVYDGGGFGPCQHGNDLFGFIVHRILLRPWFPAQVAFVGQHAFNGISHGGICEWRKNGGAA